MSSILDAIIAKETQAVEEQKQELAASNVLRQQMMEKAGELQRVHFIGPNNSFIPGFYSPDDHAFLPEFKPEK